MQVGSKIVKPLDGAGTITGVEKKDFYGEDIMYITLKMVNKEMEYNFPATLIEEKFIRPIATTEEIFAEMRKPMDRDYLTTSNWNKRYQATLDKMKIGTPAEMAQVIVNLKRHDLNKGLSSGERQLFHQAMDILTSEIMLIEDIDREKAYNLLETTLKEVTACEEPSE